MQYAIFGDIHSSLDDLEKVLADIEKKAPHALKIGTGDLFECTISKRNITGTKYNSLTDVMVLPDGFEELLNFPSVFGNQEERILFITDTEDPIRKWMSALPETINLGQAIVIHGHQWEWGGEPWSLIRADVHSSPVFYGHSHQSGLRINGSSVEIQFFQPYPLNEPSTLVNVGATHYDREWVLYDMEKQTVTFMKA